MDKVNGGAGGGQGATGEEIRLFPFGEPGKSRHAEVTDIRLAEFKSDGAEFQMLLGRDVLCKGMFQMSGYDGRFTFCL